MLANGLHASDGNTFASVRSIAASPKVSAGSVLGAPGLIGSVTLTVFTAPSAKPAADRLTRLPQHGTELAEKHWLFDPLVTHDSRPRTGLPPPFVKSKVMRMSPAVRTGTALAAGWLPHSTLDWFNSKSMFAE